MKSSYKHCGPLGISFTCKQSMITTCLNEISASLGLAPSQWIQCIKTNPTTDLNVIGMTLKITWAEFFGIYTRPTSYYESGTYLWEKGYHQFQLTSPCPPKTSPIKYARSRCTFRIQLRRNLCIESTEWYVIIIVLTWLLTKGINFVRDL